ncbi:MAG: hypothetical protein K0Q72_1740 [Armatimonadetes bacterium]|jgi:hypothetical protein|nr:hypothetical protein [Armatimonadota bacterium]
MDQFQVSKPVGITIAVVFALLIGGGLWYKFNPPGLSQQFMMQDADRNRREEGDAEKLRGGATPKTPEEAAAAQFHSDKAYQPEK